MPTTLAIDIETYSSNDLLKCGVYKYVEAPDFEILLFAYSFDGGPVVTLDLTLLKESREWSRDKDRENNLALLIPTIAKCLVDDEVLKTAYNANFERTCIAKYFGISLPPKQWECTLVKGGMLGLPMNLDAVSKALRLDQQKDASGKALIRYFSVPCKPTKANGMRTRNLPADAPDKWQQYKDYCAQDVRTEQAVRDKIRFFEIPAYEKQLWCLDQRINDEGVLLDTAFVLNAIKHDTEYKERLTAEAVQLTGLSNPNSAAQLKDWLSVELDEEIKTLRKDDVPALLANTDCGVVTRVLQLRQEMSKSSVKKYHTMHAAVCQDSRVRGLLQFYGANRTGRWAGRLVQVQNLPRNEMKDLDLARELVADDNLETLELLFGNVPNALSQLIRTAFIAPPGKRFIVADFSAIEARVIAWLAGEKWRLDVFNTHGKIYEASASQMFKVPLESITKGSDLRQKGKVSELALGYQGGPGALITMGALKMGLLEEELPALVKMWRNANPAIVNLWYMIQDYALDAIQNPGSVHKSGFTIGGSLLFFCKHSILYIRLPSGRELAYVRPRIIAGPYGDAIQYEGMNQTTKKWELQDTYGGKLVENIVQAIARDCLADSMLRLDAAGYKIVMSIHDEVVLEVSEGTGSTAEVDHLMGQPLLWAKGLPLKAESYETNYYKKD